MTTSQHQIRFPQESEVYRTARDDLLLAELELRRQLEWVAALRRNLPLGGALTEDYLFDEGDPDLDAFGITRKIRLSELFADGKDSLILYSFMYGPDMARPCASCTSMLDGLNGSMLHALQRVNVAVVAKSPIQRILLFALQRGWHNLHMLSSAHNSFNADYHGETADGRQLPALNVFVRRAGRIYHFYNTELLYTQRSPAEEPRHLDLLWPLWNLFDLTPEGRGGDWHPALAYQKDQKDQKG